MPMSRHARAGHRSAFLLVTRTAAASPVPLLLVFFLLLAGACSAERQLSTVAISHSPNATLVCALVTANANGGDATPTGGSSSKLHCTSLPDWKHFEYPSADIPYNAIAAGTDFLCGLMAPAVGAAGGFACWGDGAPAVAPAELPANMTAIKRTFRAELRLLSRVNHRNLVQLLGFCEDARAYVGHAHARRALRVLSPEQ